MANRDVTLTFSSKNAGGVKAELDAIATKRNDLNKTSIVIPIDARDEDALAKMDEVTRRAEELGVGKVSFRITADGDDADATMDAIRAKADALGLKDIKIRVSTDGADKATISLSAVTAEAAATQAAFKAMNLASKETEDTAFSLGEAVSKVGEVAMPALIGAGIALSPVLVTVAAGLGLFGGAAFRLLPGIVSTSTGLQDLEHRFDGFSDSLKPEVVTGFNDVIGVADKLLTGLEPVARTAGSALDNVLAELDASFNDEQWHSFFQWMASNAGPDVQMLGSDIVNLVNTLPGLLRGLQPVANEMLQWTQVLTQASADVSKLTGSVGDQTQAIGPLSITSSNYAQDLKGVANAMLPGLNIGTQLSSTWDRLTQTTTKTAKSQVLLADDVTPATLELGMQRLAVTELTTAIDNLIDPLLSLEGDQVSWKQAQQAANAAIKQVTGSLNSNTSSALTARQAIIQSTLSAIQFADQEVKVHGNINAASSVLEAQIRYLEQHAGKSKIAAAEIDALRQALGKLPKTINQTVHVNGVGKWSISGGNIYGGTGPGVTGGGAPGVPAAAHGMLVRGGTPGKDSVLIRAMPGELVVPTHLVPSVAPMLRGRIPGFAAGGVVPSSSSLAGMPSWALGDDRATITDFDVATKNAIVSALQSVTSSGHAIGSGVRQWTSDVLLALSMLGEPASLAGNVLYQMQTESSGNPMAINLTDTNAKARNWSQGLMQVVPTTFARYRSASLPDDIDNPLANIYAAINYAINRYGRSLMSGGMGIGSGHGYASGGFINEPIAGIGLATGARYSFGEIGPETVIPGRYSGRGDTYMITVQGDSDPDGAALRIIQKVRDYKRRHGNVPTGMG
jgi:SLT domain-containing protein